MTKVATTIVLCLLRRRSHLSKLAAAVAASTCESGNDWQASVSTTTYWQVLHNMRWLSPRTYFLLWHLKAETTPRNYLGTPPREHSRPHSLGNSPRPGMKVGEWPCHCQKIVLFRVHLAQIDLHAQGLSNDQFNIPMFTQLALICCRTGKSIYSTRSLVEPRYQASTVLGLKQCNINHFDLSIIRSEEVV